MRRGAVSASRVQATLTTYTFYSDATDTYVVKSPSSSGSDGGGSSVDNVSYIIVGEDAGNGGYEGFLVFDTSSIPDSAVITSATLSVRRGGTNGTMDFTVEARSVTGISWISPSNLASKDLVASVASSAFSVANDTEIALTSEAAFLAAINKTGTTYLLINSSSHRTAAGSVMQSVTLRSRDYHPTIQSKLVVEALV